MVPLIETLPCTCSFSVALVVPTPRLPLEAIKVKLDAVIPIEVVEALETKVINCGVLEVYVEILRLPPPAIQERPEPVEERTEPAVPTLLLLS